MNPAVLERLWGYGFSIYMRSPEHRYLHYTRGSKDIAYLGLAPGGYTISTVHRPNMQTGTGFQMHSPLSFDQLTLERLLDGFRTYPDFPIWDRDRSTVHKYPSIEAWLKDDLSPRQRWRLIEREEA